MAGQGKARQGVAWLPKATLNLATQPHTRRRKLTPGQHTAGGRKGREGREGREGKGCLNTEGKQIKYSCGPEGDKKRKKVRWVHVSAAWFWLRRSTHTLTHSLTHTLTHSYTHPLTHSYTHSLTHSNTHSYTHSYTHSITHIHSMPRFSL